MADDRDTIGVLDGRVAIITGASSGIGEATARAFAEAGCRVLLVARRQQALDALAQQIGQNAAACVADLEDSGSGQRVVQAALDAFGTADILVNAAGAALNGPLSTASMIDLKRMIDLNLLGAISLSRAALPVLQRSGRGMIINIASVAALAPGAGSTVYAATKAAIRAFSEALRKEVLPLDIRVTTITPGVVADTELFDHVPDAATKAKFGQWLASMTPMQAADVADAALFAASRPTHVSVSELVLRPSQQEL